MASAFLVGRLVFGGYFIINGLNHFMSLAMFSHYAAAKGVPVPQVAVAVSGLLILFGGISIVLGWRPEWGMTALLVFLIGVSIPMHNFWAESGEAAMNDMINFTKNIALVGATLMFAAIPRPWPYSVEARATTPIGNW